MPAPLLAAFLAFRSEYEARPELVQAEGLFRVAAAKTHTAALLANLLEPQTDGFTLATSSPLQVADAMLTLARQHRATLLSQAMSEVLLNTYTLGETECLEHRVAELRLIMSALTPEARTVYGLLFNIFASVVANSATNKMAAANLAVCVSNAMLGDVVTTTGTTTTKPARAAAKPSKADIQEMQRVKVIMDQRKQMFVFLLEHHTEIFQEPVQSAAAAPQTTTTATTTESKACAVDQIIDILFDDEITAARPRTAIMQFGPLRRRGAFKVCV